MGNIAFSLLYECVIDIAAIQARKLQCVIEPMPQIEPVKLSNVVTKEEPLPALLNNLSNGSIKASNVTSAASFPTVLGFSSEWEFPVLPIASMVLKKPDDSDDCESYTTETTELMSETDVSDDAEDYEDSEEDDDDDDDYEEDEDDDVWESENKSIDPYAKAHRRWGLFSLIGALRERWRWTATWVPHARLGLVAT